MGPHSTNKGDQPALPGVSSDGSLLVVGSRTLQWRVDTDVFVDLLGDRDVLDLWSSPQDDGKKLGLWL